MRLLMRPTAMYRRVRNRVRSSTLPEEAVRRVAVRFALGEVQRVAAPAGGKRSQTVILETTKGHFALKAYPANYDALAVAFEHSLLTYLAEANFPSPRLIPAPKGETWVRVDQRYYACLAFVAGCRSTDYFLPSSLQDRLMAQASETLAEYHQLVAEFIPGGRKLDGFRPRTSRRWHDKAWYLGEIRTFREATVDHKEGGALVARWEEMYKGLERRWEFLEASESPPLPTLPIHGDYGPYNLLYQEERLAVVLDFECAHLDWRLTEVLSATVRFAETRTERLDLRRARRFLQTYHAANPLSAEEVSAAADVFALGRLRNAAKWFKRFRETGAEDTLQSAQKMLSWVDQAHIWQVLLAEVK